MKEIQLHGKNCEGKVALVDDDMYEYLNQFRWNCTKKGYVFRHYQLKNKFTNILMHREVLNTPKGMLTDHINRNKLDNQRCNLRICTNSQNIANMITNGNNRNTSGYKGVHWARKNNKWRAAITHNSKKYCIGYYDDIEDAAEAYRRKAVELFGEFACIE